MKTVAQTVIEADHFYTIAAHTGNVIQAVKGTKEAGPSVWASTSISLSRSGALSAWVTAFTASATAHPASCWT